MSRSQNLSDVEILRLGEFNPSDNSRTFDAISLKRFYWEGMIQFIQWSETESRIYAYSDRHVKYRGDTGILFDASRETVEDEELARRTIAKAVLDCFYDVRASYEVLSDGNGGWIPLVVRPQ